MPDLDILFCRYRTIHIPLQIQDFCWWCYTWFHTNTIQKYKNAHLQMKMYNPCIACCGNINKPVPKWPKLCTQIVNYENKIIFVTRFGAIKSWIMLLYLSLALFWRWLDVGIWRTSSVSILAGCVYLLGRGKINLPCWWWWTYQQEVQSSYIYLVNISINVSYGLCKTIFNTLFSQKWEWQTTVSREIR